MYEAENSFYIMSDDNFQKQIQKIDRQIKFLQQYEIQLSSPHVEPINNALEEITAALGNAQLIYEQMQTSLEVSAVIEEELFAQNQEAIAQHQHYYDLFQFCPDAYLVTDINGLIIEANYAIAQLLKTSQNYLIGKPLAVFIPQSDRQIFRDKLNQLSSISEVQDWEISLCPIDSEPFAAILKVGLVCNESGFIETLKIVVHDISKFDRALTQSTQQLDREALQVQEINSVAVLSQGLDKMRVLVVDDETDAREFITTVLESHGICVRAVATTTEALEALDRFHPNVLISDIRMPDENGYSLISKVREWETQKGWHIPAAAISAYLTEDREKAIAAGFEFHLHKLAKPDELITMVAQLAERASTLKHDR
jgi:PAS domain S-box-containing protein